MTLDDVEVLYRYKETQRGTGNHQGCKLLMWLYGYDIHFLRVRLAKPEYSSAANMNDDRIIIYPEYWRATNKSVKFWGIEANTVSVITVVDHRRS